MPWTEVLLVVLALWLIALTGVFVWLFKHINSLIKFSKGDNLLSVLTKLIKENSQYSKKESQVLSEISDIREAEKKYVQKIGLIRFNPFSEIGGDHSFSLAVLNDLDDGFVLTGLHTRERTRLYAKVVKDGRSEHELSKEEREALDKARKGK